MKIMHRQFDFAFRDRPTGVRFEPERVVLDGEKKTVITATVEDEALANDLLSRGFEPFPGEEAKAPLEGELPADFPGRAELAAAGLTTLAQVAATSDDDLLKVSGVGPATVKKIRAYGAQ